MNRITILQVVCSGYICGEIATALVAAFIFLQAFRAEAVISNTGQLSFCSAEIAVSVITHDVTPYKYQINADKMSHPEKQMSVDPSVY